MTLSVYQATVTNASGDILPSADIEVILESTGLPATIYSTRAGAALANPFPSDINGFAQFYANAGEYRITATSGLFSRVWRYVRIGDGGSYDIGTAQNQTPLNSDLGSASKIDIGTDFDRIPLNADIVYPIESVQNIAGLIGAQDDQQINLKGWHPNSDVGGGVLYWDSAKLKSKHNGGSVFSPTVPFSIATSDYLNAVGETDGAGSGCWVRGQDIVKISQWGVLGDGIEDDTASLQAAINYGRDNGSMLVDWDGGTIRTTASILNQYDASFAETNWIINGATLAPDFSGSSALIIEGGSYFQNISGKLKIIPSAGQRMTPTTYVNRDSVTHGLEVKSSRIKLSGKIFISSMKGHGILTRSEAGGNSNGAEYDAYIELCNKGWVCLGTADDLAVVRASIQVSSCAGAGFDGQTGCNVRDWDAVMQLENNCIIDTGDAGFQVDKATGCNWFIYSEQQNVSNEIEFNNLSSGNSVFSCRANKDVFVDGNIVTGGNGVHSSGFIQTFTPTVIGATTAGTASYSVQTGRYQQIGNLIHFNISVVWSGHTGTGNLRITQMPKFPVGVNPVSFSGFDIAGLANGSVPMGSVDNSRDLKLFKNFGGSTAFVEIQASGSIQVSGTYEIQ